MFAMEESTSIDCAREMRGTASMARAVRSSAASWSMSSALRRGAIRAMSVAPGRIRERYSAGGVSRHVTMSADQTSSPVSWAPAAS